MISTPPSLTNDLIITGIPRSGTSYLCSLLHEINNCVVINEPDRMSGNLRREALPYAAVSFHQETRNRLLKKESIQNKLLNGIPIEDTAIIEQYESYSPEIESNDFLLCTKNTLGYLARLEGLNKAIPHTPIIALIRNPLDTIASWKNSFKHLETASAATQHIIGALNDDFITDWQRERLLEISMETRVTYKRAMLWAYLADWIWKNKTNLSLFCYENIVTHPQETLFNIFNQSDSSFDFTLKTNVSPSKIRTNKRDLLEKEDREAIEKVCTRAAHNFSFNLDSYS